MSTFTDNVVTYCNQELAVFKNGTSKEWMADVYLEVGKYWDRLAEIKEYKNWKGYNGRSDVKLDSSGKPKKDGNKNQPWSAAFISWIAYKAGAGDAFKYAPSHSVYMVAALKEATKAKPKAKFIARRHKLYVPKVGDLIACERQAALNPSFDTYITYAAQGKYEAHCDFVVEVTDKAVITIGGNVGNSVTRKTWKRDAQGYIGNTDPLSASATVVCIIECLL